MKELYRGYTIEANREEAMNGDELLYWSIFKDDEEIDSSYTTGDDSEKEIIELLRGHVDEHIKLDMETKFIKIHPGCDLDRAIHLVRKFPKDNVSGTVLYSYGNGESYIVSETKTMIVVRRNHA